LKIFEYIVELKVEHYSVEVWGEGIIFSDCRFLRGKLAQAGQILFPFKSIPFPLLSG